MIYRAFLVICSVAAAGSCAARTSHTRGTQMRRTRGRRPGSGGNGRADRPEQFTLQRADREANFVLARAVVEEAPDHAA